MPDSDSDSESEGAEMGLPSGDPLDGNVVFLACNMTFLGCDLGSCASPLYMCMYMYMYIYIYIYMYMYMYGNVVACLGSEFASCICI